MLSIPGDLLYFSILMAFLTSSSVYMRRVCTGSSCWAGVAGWGQLSTSLKYSALHASPSSPIDRSFRSLALIGPDLEGNSVYAPNWQQSKKIFAYVFMTFTAILTYLHTNFIIILLMKHYWKSGKYLLLLYSSFKLDFKCFTGSSEW